MKEFIEMLKKIKPNVDFENEEALVDDGILESLDIISIISEIADKYGVFAGRRARLYGELADGRPDWGPSLRRDMIPNLSL